MEYIKTALILILLIIIIIFKLIKKSNLKVNYYGINWKTFNNIESKQECKIQNDNIIYTIYITKIKNIKETDYNKTDYLFIILDKQNYNFSLPFAKFTISYHNTN